MRRDPRPFVVEVRRGQKKSPQPPAPSPFVERATDDDLMRRAEEALFGKPQPRPEAAVADEDRGAASQAGARRILEAIVPEDESEDVVAEPEVPQVRRGRKPGSKNRPKEEIEAAGPKRRRGRPRKNPDSEVRSVVITPELASAALDVMARAAVAPPLPPSPITLERPEPSAAPGKRPRGRPRKQIALDLAPVATDPDMPAVSPGAMSAARIVHRYGEGAGPRAGRRWTRRLRSYANPDHVSRRLSRP